jgi:hypothetical protein
MGCLECERLRIRLECFTRVYEQATLSLNAAAAGPRPGEYMRLKTLADTAWVDVELAETETTQHQDTH